MAKIKYFHLYGDAVDSERRNHVVTVVGKFEQKRTNEQVSRDTLIEVHAGKLINGTVTFNKKSLTRKLTIGVSICNPIDDFSEAEGVRIAKKRINEGKDAGSIETHDVTMLTKDLILMELLGKLNYITSNIDDYVHTEKRKNKNIDRFDPDCDSIGA